MSPPLTIVIPTHGRPSLLGRTLASVAACERPAGYAGCLVVENGPAAGAEGVVAEAAAAHPGAAFRYLHHGRANKSAALNAALTEVAAESGPGALCVLFDDDVRVDPGVLVAYAEAAARHPRRAFFGGPVDVDYEEQPPWWVVPVLPPSARGLAVDQICRRSTFLGANWAAYARELTGIGGFDPDFGPGSSTKATGQEASMQQGLLRAGCKAVCVPGALIWHYVPVQRSGFEWALGRKFRSGVERGRNKGRRRYLAKEVLRGATSLVKLAWSAGRSDRAGTALQVARLVKSAGVMEGLYQARASRTPPAAPLGRRRDR